MKHLFFLLMTAKAGLFAQPKPLVLTNQRYRVEVTTGKTPTLLVSRTDQPDVRRTLTPAVRVIFSAENPNLAYANADVGRFPQAAWKADGKTAERDAFRVGQQATVRASRVLASGGDFVRFGFSDAKSATVTLELKLPAGTEPPVLETVLTPKQAGYFSAAFAGIAPVDTARVKFLYQPMVWSWRRFPEKPYLTPEHLCTTAATFTNDGTATEGLAPDPAEIPYRYAKLDNSRFGLLLRNAEGKAQPMLFAPILGGAGSRLEAGKSFRFRSRYVLSGGDWYAGLNHVLHDVFHYKNERRNAAVTLNQTFDNTMAFAMHDVYGGWVDSLKGFDYVQDAVGTVKIVSALHQLGAALVTGNPEIYRRRALPTMAYAMSREKYLYTVDERQKIQSPSHLLKGPCVEVGELAGLYQMTNGQTGAFLAELNRLFGKSRKLNLNTETGGGTWQDYLARYRSTRQPDDLAKAREGADAYLKAWQMYPAVFDNDPGLRDKEAAFLTDFTPKLYDLTELYEETNEKRYLDAAVQSARQMVFWLRSNPMAPDSVLTANRGGVVPGHAHKRYKLNSYESLPGFDLNTPVPEQRVEAWRTSLVGLPPEQPGTYVGGGPIMLTHHPAWFLRLAHRSGDTLLRDAAYNAVLGRYAGFPGYYFTSLETTIYQHVDYAMHPYWDVKYNAMFYNHVFPHLALLIDFLVSDAFYRSKGQVNFPSVYAPGYAYLTSKVYGHQPGTVFGEKNVRLWLPPAAIQSSSVALNHLLGVGERDLHLVLMNTTNEAVSETLRLNPDVLPTEPGRTYAVAVTTPDGKTVQTTLKDGLLAVSVPAQGLVSCKIEGLQLDVPLFRSLAEAKPTAQPEATARPNGFFRDETGTPLGTLTGMRFNVFPQFSDAYFFTDKTEKDLKSVTLRYRVGSGEWQTKTDGGYPFEFDIHLPDPKAKLEVEWKAVDLQGREHAGKTYTLEP
jgi:hypothetical protein